MQKKRLFASMVILALLAFAVTGMVKKKSKFKANLTGAVEVPGPGDPDGKGKAMITLDAEKGEICYQLAVSGITAASAAHIHSGAAGASGGVVVGLTAPANGSAKGCANLDRAKIEEIQNNPAGFYVNVHNSEFPKGAVRGQLGK